MISSSNEQPFAHITHFAHVSTKLNYEGIAILAVYLLCVLFFGSYFVKRNRDPEHFMKAGGNIPTWAVGLSIFGTYCSSISFLANPGASFASNWSFWAFNIAMPLAAIFAARYFVSFYRNSGYISCYAPLEKRFGLWARMYTSACFILTQMARTSVILYLLAIPASQLIGCSISTIIIATGILVIIYTMLGGIEAVVYVDAAQSLVLICAAILCLILIPLKTPGGLNHIIHYGFLHHKFSLGGFGFGEASFLIILLFGFTNNLQNLGIDQNYVQRYLTAKSEKAARKSIWISAILYVPVSALFFFIGTALYVYYAEKPWLLTHNLAMQAASGKGDQIFPFFIVSQLPEVIAAIIVAGFFGAALNSLSSSLNACATLMNEDIYKRFFTKHVSDKGSMFVLYLGTVLFGLLAIFGSLALIHTQSALKINWVLAGIFGGGILGLFILSIVAYRVKNTAAITGAICGVLIIIYIMLAQIPHLLPNWIHTIKISQFLTLPFGTAAIIIIGFGLTLIINRIGGRIRTKELIS